MTKLTNIERKSKQKEKMLLLLFGDLSYSLADVYHRVMQLFCNLFYESRKKTENSYCFKSWKKLCIFWLLLFFVDLMLKSAYIVVNLYNCVWFSFVK